MVLSDNKTFTIFPNEENEILIDFFAEQLGMKEKDETFINSFISWAYEGKKDYLGKDYLGIILNNILNNLTTGNITKFTLLNEILANKLTKRIKENDKEVENKSNIDKQFDFNNYDFLFNDLSKYIFTENLENNNLKYIKFLYKKKQYKLYADDNLLFDPINELKEKNKESLDLSIFYILLLKWEKIELITPKPNNWKSND